MRLRLGEMATVQQGPNRSGRSAAGRPGDGIVQLVNGGHIQDDTLRGPYPTIAIPVNGLTEKHLLRPYDVLVTGKSTSAKAALVGSSLGAAVANSTLLVVRSDSPEITTFVWWFLTSREGRAAVESKMVASATLSFLPPRALAEMDIPFPSSDEVRKIFELVEVSERAYRSAVEAAELRRNALRNAYVHGLMARGTN
jgi:hypothetical protein